MLEQNSEFFFALPQSFLRSLSLGDVFDDRQGVNRFPITPFDEGGRQISPANITILRDVTLFSPVVGNLALPHVLHVLSVSVTMVWMREVEEGPSAHFLCRVSKHLTKRGIRAEESQIAARQHHANGTLLKDFAETLFTLAQRLFRWLALLLDAFKLPDLSAKRPEFADQFRLGLEVVIHVYPSHIE